MKRPSGKDREVGARESSRERNDTNSNNKTRMMERERYRDGDPDRERVHQIADTVFAIGARYSDLNAIGKGSYGVVCSALDAKTEKKVAIKKITPVVKHTEDAKHVLREIRLMRYLGIHENIVTLEDLHIRESSDELYIIMELFDTDLHRVISSRQPLSENHFKHFFFQLLCGVKFMHMNRIIHRDLKPANLLVSRDCKLRITDFGLARERPNRRTADDLESSVDDPMTEHVVTRWYRACELMLLPDGLYTYAVDMWACGCILGEMLGRKPLFPGKNFVHQLTLIFDIMGSPQSAEVSHIRNSQARKYLDSQLGKKKKPFNTLFPSASVDALALLDNLLIFDPTQRITADQALISNFLIDAGGSSRKVCLTFPRVDDRLEFGFEKGSVPKAELKELILQEVHSFRDELEGNPVERARSVPGNQSTRALEAPAMASSVSRHNSSPDVKAAEEPNQRTSTKIPPGVNKAVADPKYHDRKDHGSPGDATVSAAVDNGVTAHKSLSGKSRLAWSSRNQNDSSTVGKDAAAEDQYETRVGTMTKVFEKAMKKIDDPSVVEKALVALRSPSHSNTNSPVREFIRNKGESSRSGSKPIVGDLSFMNRVNQLFSPERGSAREKAEAKLDLNDRDKERDRDSVLMSSREHKDNMTAFLASAIEADYRTGAGKGLSAEDNNVNTKPFSPGPRRSSAPEASAPLSRGNVGADTDTYAEEKRRDTGSHNMNNGGTGGAAKKSLTVPKGPTFRVMSWQRKQAEFDREEPHKLDDKTRNINVSNLLRPTASSAQKSSNPRSMSNPRGRVEKKIYNDGLM
jgi:serine/threonine protein kinase